ncbi:MAG TPA: type I DNA topoisomerase, partial [Tenuifilaceae bacterium]|nr:type I DNA topoisomerase [Tenuifilaceae bacterium]
MIENLVIVESPAKAKTIEKFLGKQFVVKSSFGHIRDLSKKNLGVEIAKNYKPEYIISDDKKKLVDELKKASAEAQQVWLASDEDREGEAIAWHLAEVLKLDPKKTKRIVFHEITKDAILNAIKNPRGIDINLVNSQQARRILDRMVGFELSPILWKKVKPSLSAGRVQSVAVRLIVEKEREIIAFNSSSFFRVTGLFKGDVDIKAELSSKLPNIKEATRFIEHCKTATFKVLDVTKKPTKKSPPPPFTTSTLQQEASRKFNFSVSQTMTIAQKLYESGYITYMRTDSVNLSATALDAAKQIIVSEFGDKYHHLRQFKTKSKGAQEAHEAIRPTYFDKVKIPGSAAEQKLYDLIWKRTLASQMSDAQLEKTTINIEVSKSEHQFVATGEVVVFDGFLKVYFESTDDDSEEGGKDLLPSVKAGQLLDPKEIAATERFTQ